MFHHIFSHPQVSAIGQLAIQAGDNLISAPNTPNKQTWLHGDKHRHGQHRRQSASKQEVITPTMHNDQQKMSKSNAQQLDFEDNSGKMPDEFPAFEVRKGCVGISLLCKSKLCIYSTS